MGSAVQATVGMSRVLWPKQGFLAEYVASEYVAITQRVSSVEAEVSRFHR